MISAHIKDIADAITCEPFALESGRKMVTGLTWDSREVSKDSIFLAMPGERVDGNDFIRQAIVKGAGLVIATRKPDAQLLSVAGEFSCPILLVDDGQAALTELATWWRKRLHAVVIGVTGSTGKTSSKDFLASVLSNQFNTAATKGNHNNEIGVPATVLSASLDTDALIVEMGMRGMGQIEKLCKMVRPTIGCITNIGVSHLELLGSQENIARAKGELLEALPASGLAVLNADDEFTPFIRQNTGADERGLKVLTYGFAEDADVRATDVTFDDSACPCFTLHLASGWEGPVHLSMPGRHNVKNALLAAAVGAYLGMQGKAIVAGLEAAQGSGMRLEIVRTEDGITFVNDAYNANPDSMAASLDTLAHMDCTERRIAILGDMGELGPDSYNLHVEVGKLVPSSNVDMLICVGDLARGYAEGAEQAGMNAYDIIMFDTVEDADYHLRDVLYTGDLVLVKASRFMGLERLIGGMA